MSADALILRLQAVLGLHVKTGKIILNLKDSELQSFEASVYGRPTDRAAPMPKAG